MVVMHVKSATFVLVVLCFALSIKDSLFAQNAVQSSREGFTGQQLFEHEWHWIEQPVKRDAPESDLKIDRSGSHTREALLRGDDSDLLKIGDGLGPMHNANSCQQCHPGGGASGVERNVTLLTVDPRSKIIELPHEANQLQSLFPALLRNDGMLNFTVVVHNYSTRPGYQPIRERLAEHVPDGLNESWFNPEKRSVEAIARQPVIAGRYLAIDFYLSQRNSPPLFGLGLVETIDTRTILRLAVLQDKQSNGTITGRFVGKFGWRGQGQNLNGFVRDACSIELGLTSHDPANVNALLGSMGIDSVSNPQADDVADAKYVNVGLDLSQSEFVKLASYVQSIPQPVERVAVERKKDIRTGERLFNSIGCDVCHVPDVHPVRGLFSDLLLHDMGPELQAPTPAPIASLRGKIRIMKPTSFTLKHPKPKSSSRNFYGDRTEPLPYAPPTA